MQREHVMNELLADVEKSIAAILRCARAVPDR